MWYKLYMKICINYLHTSCFPNLKIKYTQYVLQILIVGTWSFVHCYNYEFNIHTWIKCKMAYSNACNNTQRNGNPCLFWYVYFKIKYLKSRTCFCILLGSSSVYTLFLPSVLNVSLGFRADRLYRGRKAHHVSWANIESLLLFHLSPYC